MKGPELVNPTIEQLHPGMVVMAHDRNTGAQTVIHVDLNLELVLVRCFQGGTLQCDTYFDVSAFELAWEIQHDDGLPYTFDEVTDMSSAFGAAVGKTLRLLETL